MTKSQQYLILLLMSCPISCTNKLEDKVQTVELHYITWACACANWATREDIQKFTDNTGDSLANRSIFVEPADSSLFLPDTIGYNGDIVEFTGQFYQKKGFSKGRYRSAEHPDKARVFRYTKYTVLQSTHKNYQ